MKYSQFVKRQQDLLYECPISKEARIEGNHVAILENGNVFMNRQQTGFSSLDEAIRFIKTETYKEKAWVEAFNKLPANTLASIIREHNKDKITNSLIESYLDVAFNKTFTVDPIVIKIRELVELNAIDGKIDFVLEDGSTVAIGKPLLEKLSLENDKYIDNMRKSINAFHNALR